jgi:hypothetical protein
MPIQKDLPTLSPKVSRSLTLAQIRLPSRDFGGAFNRNIPCMNKKQYQWSCGEVAFLVAVEMVLALVLTLTIFCVGQHYVSDPSLCGMNPMDKPI